MDQSDTAASLGVQFRLDEWLVQPSLNRISHGKAAVQLEPKVMDVLVALAARAGTVVSKDTLIDTVWQRQFISEWVISRAIAKLRSALEDDARNPRFIETISKRGYRLRVEPVPFPAAGSVPAAGAATIGQKIAPESGPARSSAPVGFCGRRSHIGEILDGPRNWIWLLGTRGIGKTTLLREIERLTLAEPARGYVPVVWDLQGAGSPQAMHEDFGEALRDARERLLDRGIDIDEVIDRDLFVSLGHLRRRVASTGATLLLLCDEVEELIHLQAEDPSLLRKLRRALQSQQGIRSVLASSPKLWALAEHVDDTSPFLHGFTPPLYLGALAAEAGRSLAEGLIVRDSTSAPPDSDLLASILNASGGHPFLIQTLCERYRTHKSLRAALDETVADRGVGFLFSVDLETLVGDEREVLRLLARRGGLSLEALPEELGDRAQVRGILYRLEHLGLVRQIEREHYSVNGGLLLSWLRSRGD